MKNPSWRDRYYVVSTEGMLATAFNINKHRKISWTSGQPDPDLLCSSHSKSSLLTASSSQSSIPASSTRRLHKRRSLASLPSSRRTSNSLSEASVEQHLAAIQNWNKCSICGQEFEKIPDQKRNHSRHVRVQHGESEPFKCPDPDCGRLFTNKYNCNRHAAHHQSKSVSSTDLLSPGYVGERNNEKYPQGLSRSRSQ
jgi:hypothetical protein